MDLEGLYDETLDLQDHQYGGGVTLLLAGLGGYVLDNRPFDPISGVCVEEVQRQMERVVYMDLLKGLMRPGPRGVLSCWNQRWLGRSVVL